MRNPRNIFLDTSFSLICGVILGSILSAFSPGSFLQGMVGAGVLSAICVFVLVRVWRLFKQGKRLAILITVAFLLRVGLGIFLQTGLSVLGFDNPVQNAGYVYSDAYERDQAAFKIASTEKSFLITSGDTQKSDQYGGLLSLSILIYRVFSENSLRPLLMTLLSAFMMALGLAFFWDAVRKHWGGTIAIISSIVLALYPDGLLLGSSQMREPYLIGLTCIAFWAAIDWKVNPLRKILTVVISILLAIFISVPSGLAITATLFGIVLVDWIQSQASKNRRILGFATLILFCIAISVAGWMWLKQTLYYDAFITQTSSGWISQLMENIGTRWRIPFVTLYGLTQPLLPAAIFDPSLPIWVGIAIFRASGWYLAIPILVYGLFSVLQKSEHPKQAVLIWLTLLFFAWVLISSARAGGDQWDNPRYRMIFLPWMALLIGWVWAKLREHTSTWFWRWVAVEGVFLLFFMNWYLNRRFPIGTQLPFFWMIALIGGISAVILVSGFIWDLAKKKIKNPVKSSG